MTSTNARNRLWEMASRRNIVESAPMFSKTLKFGETLPVKLLCSFPIKESVTKSRHWPWPKRKKEFVPGDVVYVTWLNTLVPFETAGSGFEIKLEPKEGVDFEFIDSTIR